jgi:Na+/melibiose symporter-like transporter
VVGKIEYQTKSERARVLLFRCLAWCFVGFGVLSTISVATGLTFAIIEDAREAAKLWWLFIMLSAVSILMVVIGIKGTKINSVSQLEAQDEAFEQRKEKLASWLHNRAR